MPEEHQSPDTGSANGPEEQPLVRVPAETDTENGKRSNLLLGLGVIVVIALIIAGLMLPPISLPERLGWTGGEEAATAVPEQPTPTQEIVDTTPTLPDGVTVSSATAVAVQRVSSDEFFSRQATAAATPPGLTLTGDVYTLAYDGDTPTGQIAFPLPADAGDERTLDLYGWDGSQWRFMASQIDSAGRQVASHEAPLPQALALMQVNAPELPAVATTFGPDHELPVELLPHLAEVAVGPLYLNSDGELDGTMADLPTGAYSQLLHVTNVQDTVDQSAIVALLSDEAIRSTHMAELLEAVEDFAGLNIDYQGVPSGQRAEFTSFVTEVADALHSEGKVLILTLGTPNRNGEVWEMGGHDWASLGQLADAIYVKLPLSPAAYGDGGEAEQLLQWATRYVNRHKLNAQVSGVAVELLADNETYVERANQKALAAFGTLEFVEGEEEVEPGTPIEVALSGTASPFEWDGSSLTYFFTYENDDETLTVWLGNEAAVSHRLRLADRYNLRGVTVTGLGTVANGEGYAAALESYLSGADAPEPAGAAIAWTVRDEEDSVIASASGNELSFSWDGSEEPGSFLVTVEFALGETVLPLDSVTIAYVETEEVVEGENGDAPATTPVSVGDADAVVNTAANVRTGPGLGYGTVSGGAAAGTRVSLIGRNSASTWLNIVLPDNREGWMLASLLTVNPNFSVASLDVIEVDPPTIGGNGGSPPPPVSAPPVAAGNFELGGQTHTFANPQLMSQSGMNWVKFQHKWNGPNDDPAGLAGRIQQAHANGFKVLLSIPGQLRPTSIDFEAYVNFLGGVAALGPNAIEVWNEQNIDREWPTGQINPTTYVNQMLAPAYNRIKSVNPNVMVIGGAPAPTGFFGGCSPNGCDDQAYIQGMAAAGAASYMDCMGVHYNEGIISPTQSSGDPRGGHYTRYLTGMTNVYWTAFGGAVPLCYTELGYLSGQDYGGVPGGFSWAANTTIQQHAQWLAEAVSVAANSGRVRMVIVFNVDFTHYGNDPQAGYAMIRADGSCPACGTLRQVMGR
jgi:hypothetical protein